MVRGISGQFVLYFRLFSKNKKKKKHFLSRSLQADFLNLLGISHFHGSVFSVRASRLKYGLCCAVLMSRCSLGGSRSHPLTVIFLMPSEVQQSHKLG